MSGKWDVLWSPTDPQLYVQFGGDQNLKLLRVHSELGQAPTRGVQAIQISKSSYATVVAVSTLVPLARCASWCPTPDHPYLLAVGQNNGHVTLAGFGAEMGSQPLLQGIELVPRHDRPCLCVQWNKEYPNMIVVGLDKVRADSSLLLYDLNSNKGAMETSGAYRFHSVPSIPEGTTTSKLKPSLELGTSESTVSLCWLLRQAKCVVAGMGRQYLRIFDIREDTQRPQAGTLTRAVFGTEIDPLDDNRLASFSENSIHIWDLRNFDKAMMTITKPTCNVTKLQWSPTKQGCLAALGKDAHCVRLFDVQHAPYEVELLQGEVGDSIVEHAVHTKTESVSSFQWHPQQHNRVLTISVTGEVNDLTVHEKLSLSWLPSSRLIWAIGNKLGQAELSSQHEEDIAAVMHKRALAGYGLAAAPNLQYIGNDPEIKALWTWIDRCQRLLSEGRLPARRFVSPHLGAYTLLEDNNQSAERLLSKSDLQSSAELHLKQYSSAARQYVRLMCGWEFDDSSMEDFLKRLELEGQYERAAAIALWHLRFRRAIDCLTVGATSSTDGHGGLHLVAMAMAGFSNSPSALWRDMCSNIRVQLHHPYLQAAFSFLSAAGSAQSGLADYSSVVSDYDILLADKVAFATLFLNDAQLLEFTGKKLQAAVQRGQLDGLLLTGLSTSGLNLLQNYINRTSDIQTASLVVAQSDSLSDLISLDNKVDLWLQSYRDLLDRWRLWHTRAHLDVQLGQSGGGHPPPPQVFAACVFCMKSIASDTGRGTGGLGKAAPAVGARRMQPKATSCPSCRRPLPRCSLCLLNMGTVSQFHSMADGSCLLPGAKKKSQFENWFTWCQACRHGGHASHVMQWFKEHSVCAVTTCECRCNLLDQAAHLCPVADTDGKT